MNIKFSWAERVYEDDFVLLETKRLMATRLQAWFVYFTESLITYSLSIMTLVSFFYLF